MAVRPDRAEVAATLPVAGIGVGFAEEILFRGIILRSLRNGRRTEVMVMLISSVWFGAMHLINAFLGSPVAATVTQVIIASLSGMTLYMFRRSRGLILTGMIVHGIWDISTFLPAPEASTPYALFEGSAIALAVVAAIIGGVAVSRHDRHIAMGPDGPVTLSG